MFSKSGEAKNGPLRPIRSRRSASPTDTCPPKNKQIRALADRFLFLPIKKTIIEFDTRRDGLRRRPARRLSHFGHWCSFGIGRRAEGRR